MKSKKAIRIFIFLFVITIVMVGNLFAQQNDQKFPQGERQERFLAPPLPPPIQFVSTAISPDSKYLYVIYGERIYQYELPTLKFLKSVTIDSKK